MNKFPLETPSVDIVLKNTKVLSDDLRDHKMVYLYYNSQKVGRMEFGVIKSPLQNTQYVLRSYKIDGEYSDLFKGEESPIITLTTYVKTLLV
jgi:hypothetical protein